MAVSPQIEDLINDDMFLDLSRILDRRVLLKCEGLNLAGSVKMKAAASMVVAAEEEGRLRPGSVLVESSSGNLGVALSMIAANRGYRFVCVTDPRSNLSNRKLMTAAGAEVVVIEQRDGNGGFLGSRIRYVQELCASDSRYVWLNQYENRFNWIAHYRTTAQAILRNVPDLDFLFVGAGTTGTLMGCARYFKEVAHPAKIIAVDTVGSVTFGGPSMPRYIPGLGTSRRPELLDESYVDEVVLVEEGEAVRTCRSLARHGFLLGGSTGTVLAAVNRRMRHEAGNPTCVAISPDLGERYLDSIYDDAWVTEHFGLDVVAGVNTHRQPASWSVAVAASGT
ncbi:2,3-diaminopropionate biosynthesis protein SbnA [Longimycelium tulufanense]|uniref:2,3-diaminopropionate biosynthesis protein SbnA n=1 Tax=Longimycelium tulufanense TaxID=907463 RepID=UPI00227B9C5E|nr:2,3-diaminopropionate biosynthesis protein SbnA [Longimycelium tulufanense]